MTRVERALLLLALPACLHPACKPKSGAPVEITVSAASDLSDAFAEAGPVFEAESGVHPLFTFGSTGQLARQIEAGAPVDVFAGANTSFVEALEKKDRVVPGTRALYARGHLVLWTKDGAEVKPASVLDLKDPRVKRIAIANPDHAAYGIAARQALQSAGIWDEVQPRLVVADNVRQALQSAQSGNVDVAIVALSSCMNGAGRFVLIPESEHEPIDQAFAVIAGTQHPAEAKAFVEFFTRGNGRVLLQKYGYLLPGEELPTGATASPSPPT